MHNDIINALKKKLDRMRSQPVDQMNRSAEFDLAVKIDRARRDLHRATQWHIRRTNIRQLAEK